MSPIGLTQVQKASKLTPMNHRGEPEPLCAGPDLTAVSAVRGLARTQSDPDSLGVLQAASPLSHALDVIVPRWCSQDSQIEIKKYVSFLLTFIL